MDHKEKPLFVTLAENVVLASTDGDTVNPVERLRGADPEVAFSFVVAAAAEGIAAGSSRQAPADDRLTLLGNALRAIHVREMFGDCVEDGDRYPCRTVRALDIMGAGTAPVESSPGA